MSSTNPVPYIPLLEGYSGHVYLTNSTAAAGISYATGGDQAATQPLALQNNVIGFSKALGSGQGRLQIAYDSVSDTTQLQYIGGSPTSPNTWDAAMADNFPVSISLTDIAYINAANQYDLYTFVPPASGANGAGAGGSQFTFDVWALCQPQIASISPTSITADGSAHIITISLARRLHSSQSPTISPSITGSGVTLGTPTPITNANGQLTGWSMTATALAAQPTSTQSITFALTENATYLSGDSIITNALTYPSSTQSLTIVSEVSSAIPIAATAATLVGGSGTDVTHGLVTATSGVIAGGLTAQVTLTSGTLSDLTAPVNIVALPYNFATGTTSYTNPTLKAINNRTTIVAMTPVGAPSIVINAQGNNVYQQQYYANFDTSTLLLDPSGNAYPQWQIGYSATGPTVPYTNWFGTYVNGNLTGNTAAYTVYALVGGDEYAYSSGVWEDAAGNPAINLYFSGTVQFYISPNWNPENVINSAPEVLTLIQYQVDGGTLTTSNLTTTYTAGNGDIALGLASIDTTKFSVPTGNHSITWKLTTDLDTGATQTQVQTATVAFSTNQSAIGGAIPDYTVSSTSATTQTFVQNESSSVSWVLTYKPSILFAGSLSFSITGLPSTGTTHVFTPSTLSLLPGGTALNTTLTLTASGAPVGNYPITIHAKSGASDDAPFNALLAVEAEVIAPANSFCCFLAGTQITMEDETLKNIEDIRAGDRVASYDAISNEIASGVVGCIFSPFRNHINHIQFEDGRILNVTSDHPLFTTDGWKSLDPESTQAGYNMVCDKLSEGDRVLNSEGHYLAITNVTLEMGEFQTHTLGEVGNHSNFFANGLLAHNRQDFCGN